MADIVYLEVVGTFEVEVEAPRGVTDSGKPMWFGESKEKKSPFLMLPFVVIEGPHQGKRIKADVWLTEKAFDRNIQMLKEVFDFDGDLAALHRGAQTLARRRANITTESESYIDGSGKQKSRVKVKWINPPGGGAVKVIEESKVQSLLSSLGPKAKAIAKSTPTKAAASPAPASSPVAGDEPPASDDVPF